LQATQVTLFELAQLVPTLPIIEVSMPPDECLQLKRTASASVLDMIVSCGFVQVFFVIPALRIIVS
jgi:hypothetical protein